VGLLGKLHIVVRREYGSILDVLIDDDCNRKFKDALKNSECKRQAKNEAKNKKQQENSKKKKTQQDDTGLRNRFRLSARFCFDFGYTDAKSFTLFTLI